MKRKLFLLLVGIFYTGVSLAAAAEVPANSQQARTATQQTQTAPSLNPNQDKFFFVIANPNTIDPQRFIFNVKAGGNAQDDVLIKNGADVPLTFSLYGADGTQTAQGTFALKTKNETMDQIGKWVNFDQNQITLQPGQSQRLRFTVAVPSDTPSGTYSGGVAAEKTRADASNPNITIAVRVALRVDVNVTGNPQPVPHKFADPQGNGYLQFYFWASMVLFLFFTALLAFSYSREHKGKSKKVAFKKKKR